MKHQIKIPMLQTGVGAIAILKLKDDTEEEPVLRCGYMIPEEVRRRWARARRKREIQAILEVEAPAGQKRGAGLSSRRG